MGPPDRSEGAMVGFPLFSVFRVGLFDVAAEPGPGTQVPHGEARRLVLAEGRVDAVLPVVLPDGAGGSSFMAVLHDLSPDPVEDEEPELEPRLVDSDPSAGELLAKASINSVRNTFNLHPVGFWHLVVRMCNPMLQLSI